MPKFIKNKDINKEKWDEVISSSPDSYIYGYSWYLDSVCEQWDALVLGEYEYVLPLPNTKKMKLDTLFQPFFHQCLDVVGTKSPSEETLHLFFNSIPKRFKIQLFRTHFKLPNSEVWKYQVISDISNYEMVQKGYSTNVKRQIKSAIKHELKYVESTDVETFMLLFKKEVGERLSFSTEDYSSLKRLIESGIKKEKFYLRFIQNNEGEVIAVAVFILEKEKIIYLKGATNDEGRKNGAMQMMIDSSIKEWGVQHSFYDCGGSNVESVASFYKRFGAKDIEYFHVDKVNNKLLKKVIDFKRKRSNHGG